MKNLILTLALILPFSVFAETISFQCTSVDLDGIHKFDAHGIVTVDDNNKVEGIANVITEKAGAVHSTQTFDDVHVTGYIRHFPAGEITKTPFDQLVLKTDADYLKTLNLLLGIDVKIASRVLSIDNFAYRSNCKMTEKFN
ncbi:MAG: hypothetical protein H7177_13140 [Rhizobacter sp.]|nr:hypothetical protein [Bacteriovorax sp.]